MDESLRALIGQDLAGFTIVQLTGVYEENEDGRAIESVGFFRSPIIAKGFVGDNHWRGTRDVLALTNGQIAFLMDGQEINLLDDEKAALEIRERAVAKLSAEERSVLGL